jgi:toxin FitB
MIIVDTNVLGALMHIAPEAPVVAWLHRQPAESVWITSITLFEARFGLALLPSGLGDGKRSRWLLPAC